MKKKYYYHRFTPTASYTVTFDLNGHGTSEVPGTQTVLSGEYATKPSNPTESSAYNFTGWYLYGSNIEWDFLNDKVTNNIVLYAGWLKVSTGTRAGVWLNNKAQDMNAGKLVSVNQGQITVLREVNWPEGNFYVGVYSNETIKAPFARLYNGRARALGSTSGNNERYILWVNNSYRLVAGFVNTSVVPYGVLLIHTDTINGQSILTEEIIQFNNEPFIMNWGSNFEAKDLIFTAHQDTLIWVLYTEFPT